MNNNFNWTNLISLNSSQNDAFEELLCQLAKKEPIENKKEFIKVGNPDGGVECYVVLDNDEEIGFQAKWFLSTPQDTQWNQIEHSFETALKTHPNMIQYYVAIPLDRADPRVENRQSFMSKWNKKTTIWKQYAKDKYNRDIDFVYWGSSEFIDRLSREENVGLKKFFFGEIDLSRKWFQQQNELAIKDLGARYTPEINIELEFLLENFDALSRNEQFKKRVDKIYHEFMVSYRNFLGHVYFKNEELDSLKNELSLKLDNLEKIYDDIDFFGIKNIDNEKITQLFAEIAPLSYKVSELLYKLNEKEIEDKNITTSSYGSRRATEYDSNIRDFSDYLSNMQELQVEFPSNILKLANNPYMILDGEAGIGKSHLLADIVTQRMDEGYDSIFLLGQHFRNETHPWSQILNDLLRLKCNESEFLGALNSKADTQNRRIIIFIDAINEGKGRSFWNDFLIAFIESIKQYEWLGLVLSIRTSYFDFIVPKEIIENKSVIQITHSGFQGVEYNASKLFFKNYNIAQPSVPLLHPEFSNPLFLKLFCEGLNKRGLTTIPDGYEGITNIIKFFIEGIEAKLIKKYPNIKSLKLIDKVIKSLISEMIHKQTIAYDEAYGLVENIVSRFRLESGLLDDLITEGLLSKNIFYDNREPIEGIYFAYERFEDHLKVRFLFDTYLDKENPKKSFEQEPLKGYFEDRNIYFYKGIIEAMSIQLSEICNVELIDMVNQNELLIESFFYSFQWRKAESITSDVHKRLLKNIRGNFQEDIFKVLFSNSSNPKHPLNALFLHKFLSPFNMRDRDVFFITLLNSIYLNEEINPIKRLIDWAWSNEDKSYISDESLLLTSMTLSWFLTTSNRQLRDYSTKALISILQGRVFVLLELLKKFENIDELYIYERLFAVAYGVVVRIEDKKGLKALGEYIYETIFNVDEVYTHILLRDYAKNTIDYMNYMGIGLDIDFDKVKPPYKSFFPKVEDLPTNEEIEAYEDRDENYLQSRVISSMMTEYGNGKGYGGYGDFGRYVFGSALYHFECKKNEQLISNYAIKKIFEEYGYDGAFFNKTEKTLSSMNNHNYDRYNHKVERIGKKYQWIAMHDTLAKVTDNFKMYNGNSWGEDKKELQYKGSFEPYVRDIDPTILLKSTNVIRYDNTEQNFFWNPKFNFNWKMENESWIEDIKDLPNPKDNIEFIDENNQSWIALTSFPNWREPLKKGYDEYKTIHKSLWYQLRSYLIPKKDLSLFIEWASRQNFYGRWMPEEKDNYAMFNREHYWSEAYNFFQNIYYRHLEWTRIEEKSGKEDYLNEIALTTDKYYWESGFDYSKEDSLSILKPSRIIFEGLEMQYSQRDGKYINKENNVICFEASVYNESHQCLLVQKDELLKFLDDNELTIFWTTIGEKQVFTPNHHREDFLGLMEVSGFSYLTDGEIVNGDMKMMYMDAKREKYSRTVDIDEVTK
jgi:hypothetical protein